MSLIRSSIRRRSPVQTRTAPVAAALAATCLACLASTVRAQSRISGEIIEFNGEPPNNSFQLDHYDAIQPGDGVTYDQDTDTINQIPGLHSQANSSVDITGLRAHTFAQVLKPFQTNATTDPFPHTYGIEAISNAMGDYSVTVNNPLVAPGTSLSTAFNVRLHGEVAQGGGNTPDTINRTRAITAAQVAFSGIPGGGGFSREVDNGTELPHSGTVALMNFDGDDVITTGSFTVKNGVPFTITVQLQTTATAIGDFRESFTAEANADFSNTLTFATDRPVFDLPAGYTANSVDAGIVNNMFIAPEPGCVSLGGAALVLFMSRSRRYRAAPCRAGRAGR